MRFTISKSDKRKFNSTKKTHNRKLTPTVKILLARRQAIMDKSAKYNYLSDEDDYILNQINKKLRANNYHEV